MKCGSLPYIFKCLYHIFNNKILATTSSDNLFTTFTEFYYRVKFCLRESVSLKRVLLECDGAVTVLLPAQYVIIQSH